MTPAQRKATIAAAAVALAAPLEGTRFVAYYDPPGILTVCMGHTGADIDKSKRYTMAECTALMDEDMLKAVDIVEKCQPGLPVGVAVAFSSAVYNMGPTIACSTTNSTAARMLKAKDYAGACNQLPRWDKAKVAGVMINLRGLTKRRALERDTCLQGLA